MFEKLSKNLDTLMSEAHISAEELSRRIGISSSIIRKIRTDENTNTTLSTLTALAEYFCLSISQLAGDEPFPENRQKGSYKFNPTRLKFIPIISWEEIVKWQTSHGTNKERPLIATEHEYSDNAYALIVSEEDWENLAKDTALLVDPDVQPAHRDFIIVSKDEQNTPTLKQILFDEDLAYLKPLTANYKITQLAKEHKIFGVVMEYKKHLKNALVKK